MNEPLTPEEYALLLSLGSDNADLAAQLEQQMAQSKLLRQNGQAPETQMYGRVAVAPHWLQYVGALANQNVANKKDRDVLAGKKQMNQNTNQQNQMIQRAILSQPQMPSWQTPGISPTDVQMQGPYQSFRYGSNT